LRSFVPSRADISKSDDVRQRLNSDDCRRAAHGRFKGSRESIPLTGNPGRHGPVRAVHPHWPAGILLIRLRRALKRLHICWPSRRAVHRCHALRSPADNRTTRPRSGSCKSSVRQKPAVMRTVSVHNVACPEADIMRRGAEVHTRGAADPTTNVFYFVQAGFWCGRRVNPRAIGRSIGNQIDTGTSLLPNPLTCPDTIQGFSLMALASEVRFNSERSRHELGPISLREKVPSAKYGRNIWLRRKSRSTSSIGRWRHCPSWH
jgi:hypothetical protein